MTVYVEYVLIDNFVIDFLLLKAALSVCGISAKKGRLFLSAAVGAAIALVYPALNLHPAILIPLKIAAGLLIVLLSAKFGRVKDFCIVSALFFAFTALLGGAIFGIYSLFGLDYTKELSAALIILPAYIVIKAARETVRFIYRRKEVVSLQYPVKITVAGVTVEATAFLDTGNNLYDGDNPVVLVSSSLAQKFFDGGRKFAIKKLPVTTVGGTLFLPSFTADKITIEREGKEPLEYSGVTLCAAKSGFGTGTDVILSPALNGLLGQKAAKRAQSGL